MSTQHSTPLAAGVPLVARFLPCPHGARITAVVVRDRGNYAPYTEAYLGADGAWHVPGTTLVLDPAALVAFTVVHDDVEVRYQLVQDPDGTPTWRATYRPTQRGTR